MSTSQSIQERVIKGSFIVLTLAFLGSIFAYLVRIILSHTLSIENYGLFYAVFGLFSIATTYVDLGFGYSVVYFFPKYIKLKDYSKAWNIFLFGQIISLTVSVILSIFLIIMAPFLANNYFKVAGSEILIYFFCGFLVVFVTINGLLLIFSGLQKEKYYASITALRWFLTLIFLITFFLLGFANIIFYAMAWFLGHALTSILFFFLLFYKHSFLTKNKLVWDSEVFKQMSALAFPSLLETFVVSAIILSDTFFLTLFKGIKEVGVYNIIYPLAFIPVIFITPINTLLLPLVSHLMEGEKQKIVNLMEKILIIIPFVGLYFALFIMMFPSSIVELIFGKKWLGLVEVQLTILSVGAIVILMNGILGAIVSGIGKIREKLKAAVVISVISVSLDIILIWYYGILGAVITISLTSLILSLLYMRIIKKVVDFSIPYLFYLKLLIPAIFFFVVIRLTGVSISNWFEFIAFGLVYTFIFMVFGLILKVYDRKLIMLILSS